MAVDDVSLQVAKGEFISFIGPSGSGKSTLINLLGCLDNATAGRLRVGGEEVLSDGRGLSEAAHDPDPAPRLRLHLPALLPGARP